MNRKWIFLSLLFTAVLLACGQGRSRSAGHGGDAVDSPAVDSPQVDSAATIMKPSVNVTRAELLGQISPATHPGFVKIDAAYTSKTNIYMRREAYESFVQMAAAAKADGFTLRILSATRNFSDQKKIWEDKWNGAVAVGGRNLAVAVKDPVQRALAILTYSSMPGTSRHHWGTDIDLNSLEPAFFNSGEGKKLYDWLHSHAPQYGWCQPYSEKGEARPHGYNEEKWHWSYLPLSQPFLAAYSDSVKVENISGFAGSETAGEIGVIEKYVMGINGECK